MCVSHLHVQLMSKESFGPLSLCSPGGRNRGPHSGMGLSPTRIPQVPIQAHKHTGPGMGTYTLRQSWTRKFRNCLNQSLTHFSQFDLPFVEVHRVRAVRFAFPLGKEEDAYEEIVGQSGGIDEEERGSVVTVSRSGSQQHLAERDKGREVTDVQKTTTPFLCGLCRSKSPSVSVWNCDGEILPFTDILCR